MVLIASSTATISAFLSLMVCQLSVTIECVSVCCSLLLAAHAADLFQQARVLAESISFNAFS